MTTIEWTDETWNPVVGCSPVSEGCRFCYAARIAIPRGNSPNPKMRAAYEGTAEMRGAGKARRAVFTGKINLLPDRLDKPLRWRKPRRVFVNSMSDLFHEDVPFDFIDQVFAVMALADQHTFQVLTKRPERAVEYFTHNPTGALAGGTFERIAGAAMEIADNNGEDTSSPWWDVWLEDWPLRHIWIGTSCEDQEAADKRIPHLLRVPAAVRFLSCEPLIGPIHLHKWLWQGGIVDWELGAREYEPSGSIDWVIVGGESGPGARPCNINWIDDIVDQCRAASVPVFVKQLGAKPFLHRARSVHHETPGGRLSIQSLEVETSITLRDAKGGDWDEWSEHLRVREFPNVRV